MRVLLVSQEFPPETGWGGIGTYLGIIAPALVRAGAEVHVLSVVRGQEPSDVRTADGVHVHRRPLVRPPAVGRLTRMEASWERLSLGAAVAFEARRLDVVPDVVEAPEWKAEGLFRGGRRATPLVVRLHSSAAQVFPYLGELDADRRLAIRLEFRAVRRADLVTGTGAQVSSVAPELGLDPARVREITYPVRPQTLLPPPEGPPRILFAGRFERRKGPETLVRALPAVRRAVPGARLVLLGRDASDVEHPSRRAWLEELAGALGVGDGLEVVERWGRDVVGEHLAAATVCAVPSEWESFGYVAAEASSVGRPVVASAIPALSEVVADHETGRLVPPGDVDAWAEALIGLLGDPARAAGAGRAAAERMRTRHDPDRIALRTLEAYEAAMRARRGRPAVAEVREGAA